jgi:hypothetical protein
MTNILQLATCWNVNTLTALNRVRIFATLNDYNRQLFSVNHGLL